jgi:hypothetical protein
MTWCEHGEIKILGGGKVSSPYNVRTCPAIVGSINSLEYWHNFIDNGQ